MIVETAFLTESQIQDYVDGVLSPRETEIVAQFLRNNPSHETVVAAYRRQRQDLEQLYRSDPSQEMFTEVDAWIAENFGDPDG